MPLSTLAGTLALPLNTVKYHVQNLVEADILEVVDERYSVKGRKVKIYALKNQLLIVAPKSANIRSLLLKYASLFGVAAGATLVIPALLARAGVLSPTASEAGPLMAPSPAVAPPVPAPALPPADGGLFSLPEGTLLFFLGCCCIILALAAGEWWGRRKGR